MPQILLVDDEPSQRQSLRKVLRARDFKTAEAGSVAEAQDQISGGKFDLVITEMNLPGTSGKELIRLCAPTPVIVMTNYASLRSAVEAMKLGAADYIAKPCTPADLVAVVDQAMVGIDESTGAGSNYTGRSDEGFFTGKCDAIRSLLRNIEKVARTDSTCLILGETGTGKELTARQVHLNSARADRRMVAVNCAAIPDTLIESELFGYEKGAFTGANTSRVGLIEAADGGTLFLDEIGELPLAAQARLLRFIQEGEIRRIGSTSSKRVNVRLLCATHRDLAALASRNEFRQDLYYRINVLRLEMPPLRERGDDVNDMAHWFVSRLSSEMGMPGKSLTDNALHAISRYHWPGNIRELEHAIERGVVMAEGSEICVDDLGLETNAIRPIPQRPRDSERSSPVTTATHEAPNETAQDVGVSEELSLEDYFQRFVLEYQDSMSETELAKKLGISRKCLWERRQRFGLPRRNGRKKTA
ncbi:response regulator CbrB [Luminiphilus syltensis NOR5-1B]|uniref:Response regulator CbrB n=1 Tax=Luminiphilus syltensis NOR5-1B TaxID=565045 RepID=B8KRY3_9GAMM|nr:sigma-54 dependent transcriptional regulator [Luminiphilus syltensis]EED36232.1 response regulator CbrB [Luminiphilus syltensis NOR5-1B]